jgi:hypothetical protein
VELQVLYLTNVIQSVNDELQEDDDMRRIPGYATALLLAAALIAPVAITSCSARASGTVRGAKATIPTDTGAAQAGNNVQQHDGSARASN